MEQKTKVCSKCGRELPTSEFYTSKRSKDGLQNYCKECQQTYNKSRVSTTNKAKEIIQLGLSAYTPRALMEELKNRGYTGKLRYVEVREIDLERM